MPPKARSHPVSSEAPLWVREPFRLFFPLGIAASIFGVLLWPLFYGELWPFTPHLQHPRILLFGFGFAFVIGFLGTAWPRFLGAEPLARWEVILLVLGWLTSQLCFALNRLQAGDVLFGTTALALLMILARRFGRERDLPPPGFALAFLAVGLAGTVGLLWGLFPAAVTPWSFIFAKRLAWEGLLLLPLLGVGSYLFPRYYRCAGSETGASASVKASPRRRALGVWLAAILMLIAFATEADGHFRSSHALRSLALILWALIAVPAPWCCRAANTRGVALRCSLLCLLATYLIQAIHPGPGFAWSHLMFLGGFGLSLLLTADRVSIGHGRESSALPEKSKLWRWLLGLTLLTAATRVSADMKASILVSHHIYAALMWAIILGIWTATLAPLWRRAN